MQDRQTSIRSLAIMVLGCMPMRHHDHRCKKCNIMCEGDVVQRLCNRNVSHWYIMCTHCEGRTTFIAGNAIKWLDIDDHKVQDDRCQHCAGQGCPNCEVNPCQYQGCTTPHHLVERHHFAPKARFGYEEADRWPQGYLCKQHHDVWHEVMR